jgi:hypothetical protein
MKNTIKIVALIAAFFFGMAAQSIWFAYSIRVPAGSSTNPSYAFEGTSYQTVVGSYYDGASGIWFLGHIGLSSTYLPRYYTNTAALSAGLTKKTLYKCPKDGNTDYVCVVK